jgi:hypothetical protein
MISESFISFAQANGAPTVKWPAGCNQSRIIRCHQEDLVKRALCIAITLAATACGADTTGKKEHGMLNCPSAVDGAKTVLQRTDDGVDLTVTADDPAARRTVRVLARVHAAMHEPTSEKVEHGGQHGGPGSIGFCPVIHTGTVVTFNDVPGGVRIHVSASSLDDVAALQLRTAQRVSALPPEKR